MTDETFGEGQKKHLDCHNTSTMFGKLDTYLRFVRRFICSGV